VRRIILTVLDGLRPDAIGAFGLTHIGMTAAAMATLFSGVAPRVHGITSDRFHLPRPTSPLVLLPRVLADHGLPTSGFCAEMPVYARPLARTIARHLGVGNPSFAGNSAPEILMSANGALQQQRTGLIFLHWPDADRAGHEHGWMSPLYARAARRLDGALGLLAALVGLESDEGTILIALSDHGGGGRDPRSHDSDHPADRSIFMLVGGRAVARGEMAPCTSLLDVAPTILHALGLPIPAAWEGRALVEAVALNEPVRATG